MAEEPGSKVFNDSVHGHICLHPLLIKVIDTLQFQRLRNLKQLGVAYYVYPAAGHCRFEHSLGTCYLAGQLVKILFQREKETKPGRSDEDIRKFTLCVELAALCHDLGHGPFSHTWEVVVKKWGKTWKHEDSSIQVLEYLISQNNLDDVMNKYKINKREIEFVKDLIRGKKTFEFGNNIDFLYQIVSNSKSGIDVDKWDYFLRDGQQLNLRITFDYRRILELCAVLEDEKGHTTIAFQDKTIMNLYDMYRVRSDLHYTAYRHKVVVNIELMIIDAFVLAGNAGLKVNAGEFSLKDAHTKAEWMCQLSDHIFYEILYSKDESLKQAKTILERILTRKLYTLVLTVNLKVPDGKKENRKAYVGRVVAKLETDLGEKYRVSEFYLDLDQQNDPIKKVDFYKKVENGKVVKTINTFQEAQKAIAPLPFQLVDKSEFQLLVFHTESKQTLSEQITDNEQTLDDKIKELGKKVNGKIYVNEKNGWQ